MSLINQMLKDLDKRRRQGESSADKGIPAGVQQLQPSVGIMSKKRAVNLAISPRIRLLILLVIGVVAGKFGWNYWQDWQTQPVTQKHSLAGEVHYVLSALKQYIHHKKPSQPASSSMATLSQLEALLTEVTVSMPSMHTLHTLTTHVAEKPDVALPKNITVQKIPNGAQVIFHLSANPVYKVNEIPSQHQLTVVLADAKWPLQDFPAPIAPIKDITVTHHQRDTLITVQMEPNTQVADMLVEKPEGNQLHFAFVHSNANTSPSAWLNQTVSGNGIKKAPVLSPVEIASRDYARALKMADRHDLAGAVVLLKKILDNVPEFHDARETLTVIYLKQKHYRQAQRLLGDGLRIAPEQVAFLNLQARLLVATGKRQRAIHLLQQHSPSIDTYPDYYAFLAALYQQNGDYLISAKLYDELVKIQPNNGLWWLGKAIGLNAYGQRGAALHAYKQAEVAPNLTPQLRAYVEEQIVKLQ